MGSNYVINQGLGDRMLSVGKLVISTPGHYEGYVEVRCMSDSVRLKDLMENMLQRHRGC